MPIISNLPKRQTYASSESRGIMTKEDTILLNSINNKLNTLKETIGVKVHSFESVASIVDSVNLSNGDVIIAFGYESFLDDGYIRIFKISNNPDNYGNGAISIDNTDLYAVCITNIINDNTVSSSIDDAFATLAIAYNSANDEIDHIPINNGSSDCAEIIEAKSDENNVVYSSLKERIDTISYVSDTKNVSRYGVKFIAGSTCGIRLYDAVGKVANPSTDIDKGINDFDSIYPWSDMIRCNGYYDTDGTFVVTAYDGEPGFSLYGDNGDVYVEIPKFFIKDSIDEDGNDIIELSSIKLSGYRTPEKFITSDETEIDKVYISAYIAGKNANNKLVSFSGVVPNVDTYSDIQYKLNGLLGYSIDDIELIRYLFNIEYATRDCQSIMKGYVDGVLSVQSGITDTVLGPSGSPVSNITGGYPCRYRYIENPWGNVYILVSQIKLDNSKLYYSKDNKDFKELDYNIVEESGYISKLGKDDNYPSCNLPIETIGTSNSYFCDFYSNPGSRKSGLFAVGGDYSTSLSSGMNSFRLIDYTIKIATRI